MAKVINCECGYTVRGETDEELLSGAEIAHRRGAPGHGGPGVRRAAARDGRGGVTRLTHRASRSATIAERDSTEGGYRMATEAQTEVREVFNAMHESRPEVVASCSGTADVVDAVNSAREQGLTVAVRGGGHSIAGLSAIEGGMLIDLAPMDERPCRSRARRAYVQGGALWADVDRETQKHGLVAPGGVVSDTGVAGLTLGGGYGWVRRKYGLSSDSVVEAEVVTADGQVLKASADENPDLYWAIRGGGGNFGIVTSFTFELHPLGPEVAFSATFYPIEEYAQVLRGWRAYVEDAPDEVTAVCVSITFPAEPGDAGGGARPSGRDRGRRLRGRRRRGDEGDASRCASSARRCSTCPARRRSWGSRPGFDPLFPRERAPGVLEVAVPGRAERRGDRRDRGKGAGAARAAHPGQRVRTWAERSPRSTPRTPRSPPGRRRTWCRSTGCGAMRPTTRPTSPGRAAPGRRSRSSGPARST